MDSTRFGVAALACCWPTQHPRATRLLMGARTEELGEVLCNVGCRYLKCWLGGIDLNELGLFFGGVKALSCERNGGRWGLQHWTRCYGARPLALWFPMGSRRRTSTTRGLEPHQMNGPHQRSFRRQADRQELQDTGALGHDENHQMPPRSAQHIQSKRCFRPMVARVASNIWAIRRGRGTLRFSAPL